MDGDPAVEPELDSFSLTFPLPYRVAFIVIAAVWGWGLNLHLLHLRGIDVPSLIRYPQRSSALQPAHHHSTYRLGTVLSTSFALSLLAFWLFTRRDPALVVYYDWMPMAYLVVLAALFVVPLRGLALPHGGRGRLLHTLRRIAVGGLAQAQDGKFGDILLADVLTSYAKVLADLFVCLCMFLHPDGSATDRPDRSCGGGVVVPLIMAAPSLVRLRQCLIEYVRVRRGPYKESAGWGGQHLANAAKYASAFPVIVLNALSRSRGGPGLYRAWLAAVAFNSLYSFYWDVAKDWDLTLFAGARDRNAPDHAWGLRRRVALGPSALYYSVVGLDLALRCTWALRLSPHLDHITDFESSVFVVEFLEVLRRWVWIFFRVETEWIRTTSTGLGVDDILLGDYQGKYEDED